MKQVYFLDFGLLSVKQAIYDIFQLLSMRGVHFLTVVHETSVFSEFELLSAKQAQYDIFELLSVRGVHFQTAVF